MVRLKGGDPFIFGRGGEELDALREAGIAIEIVPGVTAGIAAAASLQIPLTHRDVSHTVTFLSGHEAAGRSRASSISILPRLPAARTRCSSIWA